MANEIAWSWDSADTLYAHVFRPSDGYIYDEGDAAFEAIGTWNDTRAGQCDIGMSATADMHFANFPSVAAGTYVIQVKLQAGGSPDTDDVPLAHGAIYWDGSAEITAASLADHATDIKGTGFVKDTDSLVDLAHTGADGDTLETLSDEMDSLETTQGTVTNVYNETTTLRDVNVPVTEYNI